MIHDCIVIQPLTGMSIDSESDFMGSDVAMEDSDENAGVDNLFIGE